VYILLLKTVRKGCSATFKYYCKAIPANSLVIGDNFVLF
jgi:hypothetical protein